MALQTLTTLANILFRDYDPVIRNQVYAETVALTHLKRNVGVQAMKNNTFYIKTRSTGHSGVYFDNGAAGADLNTGEPSYDEPSVPARFGFGTHQITDSALVSANGDAGAIVDLAEEFANAVKLSMNKSMNRQFYQRGGTEANNAVIATVNGASTGTTVTVDEDLIAGTNDSAGPSLGTWYFYEGSLIDIGTDAQHGADSDDEVSVSSIDSRTTITINTATTVADGDHIKFRDADDNEMNGLRSAVDDNNTFQGVARGSNFWAAAYVDETAEALDEGDMITAFLETKKYAKPSVILTSNLLYKKYASLLTSMKRTSTPKEVLSGGFVGLDFASGGPGIGVVLDEDCWSRDLHIVNLEKENLVIGELSMGWLDRGEGVLQRTNLRASYWGTYKFYGNYIWRNFKCCGGLQGKTA